MIYDGTQIPLGEKSKAGFLWQNHTEHGVGLLNATLLTASHRITEIDTGMYNSTGNVFQYFRVSEFGALSVRMTLNNFRKS